MTRMAHSVHDQPRHAVSARCLLSSVTALVVILAVTGALLVLVGPAWLLAGVALLYAAVVDGDRR